jgi:molybdopterin converting factor small subunit
LVHRHEQWPAENVGALVDHQGHVIVEFFGIPRRRAGRAELIAPAGPVAELLQFIERSCPGLQGLRQADGRLSPHYLLSLDGDQFVSNPRQQLRPGDRVVLLSADAGG